jgi:hypothetical protein
VVSQREVLNGRVHSQLPSADPLNSSCEFMFDIEKQVVKVKFGKKVKARDIER